MTNKEKIQYLSRYKEADAEITRTMEELRSWKCRATKITASVSGMPHGGNGEDSLQTAIEKICDLEAKINTQIDELVRIREEVILAIETVREARLRTLLAYHYLNGNTFEEIAEAFGNSARWISKLHQDAITGLTIASSL